MPTVGRLKTRPQFLRVAAAKRKWATPGLVLQAAGRPADSTQGSKTRETGSPAAGHDDPADVRVGFTVTRRIGNAVVRNRAKRRLRAAAAEVFPRLGRKGTDYVVIGRSGTLTRPYDKLLGDLEQAIGRLDRRKARAKTANAKTGEGRTGEGRARDAGPQGTSEEAS